MTQTPMRLGFILGLLTAALLGCATLGTPTRAVGPQSSWEDIRSTPGLIVLAPQLFFAARAVSVTDLCLSGATFRAPGADGGPAELPAAGHRRSYQIGVGVPAGDGENSYIRVLFTKPFEIPACP